MTIRTGQGIDFHRLGEGRELWLGGVKIPSDKGCIAHSDGDVLLHAICDALLGAAGLEDIGHQFPDNDPVYLDISSIILLEKTITLLNARGYRIVNIDSTLCLESPKIYPYIGEMKKRIASVLSVGPDDISVKATTAEKLGFIGRGEGVVAIATVLINRKES